MHMQTFSRIHPFLRCYVRPATAPLGPQGNSFLLEQPPKSNLGTIKLDLFIYLFEEAT